LAETLRLEWIGQGWKKLNSWQLQKFRQSIATTVTTQWQEPLFYQLRAIDKISQGMRGLHFGKFKSVLVLVSGYSLYSKKLILKIRKDPTDTVITQWQEPVLYQLRWNATRKARITFWLNCTVDWSL
jgi:hypothetical protein